MTNDTQRIIDGLQATAAWIKDDIKVNGIDGLKVVCAHLDHIEAAVALLKAQEPVEPIIDTYWETPSVYDNDVKVTENKCGACGAEIDKWDKYCRVCGQAVKWE